jgi:ADP-ribosylglycohydrolase
MTSFIARFHDQLEVTGLSGEFGGWIGRRPFRYLDPVYSGAFADARVQLRQKIQYLHASNLIRMAALPGDYVRPRHNEREKGPLAADRVKAILWGTAIGDALGNTSESMTASDRRRWHGEIRHYLPNRHASEQRIGLPSDDTQLTVWTLETLLEHGGPDLPALARAYSGQRIFGIGRTMRQFLRDLEATGTGMEKVWLARQHSAGNGALMRVAGAFLPHAWTLDAGLLDTVAITSALTHDDPSSTAACVAFARILADLLSLKKPVADGWFCEAFLETAGPIEGPVKLRSRVPGDDFEGSVCEMVRQRVMPALKEEGLSVSSACNRWYSGAFLLETVPSVLYILERCKSDPQEALCRAVMDIWDNDTVAAIVGAVMGAMHGMDAFAPAWIECLSGRTTEDDDGRLDRIYDRLRALGGSGLND